MSTQQIRVTAPHQDGQNHRASANFNAQNQGSYVTFSAKGVPDNITFNVNNDKTGFDSTEIKNAGLNIKYPNPADENQYIADVDGFSGEFTMTVTFSN